MHSFHLGGPVLDDVQLDAVTLWQRNPRLGALTNHEDVVKTRCEGMSNGILEMTHLERTRMALTVRNDTDTSDIVSASDHHGVACLELHVIQDFASLGVKTDGVVDLDVRVRVSDGPAIVCDTVWDCLGTSQNLLHTAELVACFLLCDLMQDEAGLGVVQQAEILLRLLD